MKIAITSQNKREITGHAGRCRKFWIYDIVDNQVNDKTLLELSKEQAFHDSSPHEPHPLDDIQVFITGGMGMGLVQRLKAKGIEAQVTHETEPDSAVAAYLAGTLERVEPGHHHPVHPV